MNSIYKSAVDTDILVLKECTRCMVYWKCPFRKQCCTYFSLSE